MMNRHAFEKYAGILVRIICLCACSSTGFQAVNSASTIPKTTQIKAAVPLRAPVLSFNDTGLSVGDGITRNGVWAVNSPDIDWEFSLDQGTTWTRGVGTSFEVTRDGAKIIWVRARDDAGNRSEIVHVNCVLDTTAPAALAVAGQTEGVTNSLSRVWLLQIDLAGNASGTQAFDLQSPNLVAHEASGNPFQPSILVPGLHTYLIHGVVSRGDADYVTWDIPEGQKVLSVNLVQHVSEEEIAFYVLQRNKVFDAGIDV